MNSFLNIFKEIMGNDWIPKSEILNECKDLIKFAQEHGFVIHENYYELIFESVNQKLNVGREKYQHILDVAFREHISLNYKIKRKIESFVNCSDKKGYINFLQNLGIKNSNLISAFKIITEDESKKCIKIAMKDEKKKDDILTAIFVRAFYHMFDQKCCDLYFSKQDEWDTDYLALLNRRYPGFSNRKMSLVFVEIDNEKFRHNYIDGCNYYFNMVRDVFDKLDNYSDLILTIPPMHTGLEDLQWRLFSDLILFAEKHNYHTIDKVYFRYKKVAEVTKRYIQDLQLNEAKFELAAEGFVFKDCYIVPQKDKDGYSLVIILEKNLRDERSLNCPACRSVNVQGNSYPILNVRSWECKNPLCPDRSKYNRGKRFSYVSYYRQRAIEDERNLISQESLYKWHLDCTEPMDLNDIFDMACCHYSFADDTIYIDSHSLNIGTKYKYRNIERLKNTYSENLYHEFKNSPYFRRYDYDNYSFSKINLENITHKLSPTNVLLQGDSRQILHQLPNSSISAAVTSPPYYNAKSYSQWDNIYCYLYDMRNIAKEVYRVLKDGGVLLYNIFDYFDNEKNIVFSAMGNKRMILGAYTIDLFERIGFKVYGNIIWDKGEIQGNRNFNQGNNTPYYQTPLNCWEHIFVFSKGDIDSKYSGLISSIKKIKPFIKYVKGKNILGHDAPFPEEIPNIILNYLNEDDTILDPFSGSYTTGIAANKLHIPSICIEMCQEYVELSEKRFEKEKYVQLSMKLV